MGVLVEVISVCLEGKSKIFFLWKVKEIARKSKEFARGKDWLEWAYCVCQGLSSGVTSISSLRGAFD